MTSAPPAPTTVRLTLRGLPENATVTLDGEPAGPALELIGDTRPDSLSVSARTSLLPWHIA